MLVTGFTPQAELLQATADFAAGLAILFREPQAERPIGKAQIEALDHLRIVDATLREIRDRLRALLQALVVITDRLGE